MRTPTEQAKVMLRRRTLADALRYVARHKRIYMQDGQQRAPSDDDSRVRAFAYWQNVEDALKAQP